MNPGYIIGYKRGEDGKEYRYLADANGNAVSTQEQRRRPTSVPVPSSWTPPTLCRKVRM